MLEKSPEKSENKKKNFLIFFSKFLWRAFPRLYGFFSKSEFPKIQKIFKKFFLLYFQIFRIPGYHIQLKTSPDRFSNSSNFLGFRALLYLSVVCLFMHILLFAHTSYPSSTVIRVLFPTSGWRNLSRRSARQETRKRGFGWDWRHTIHRSFCGTSSCLTTMTWQTGYYVKLCRVLL